MHPQQRETLMVSKQDIRIHSIKRYGWVPDLPDARDHMYAAPVEMMAKLPAKVDLRPHCPPVYDQGQLGSCTGNAIAGAVQFDREKQKLKPDFVPSRLFIYYGERVIEGTVDTDSGARSATASRWSPSRASRRRPTGPTTSPNSPRSRRRRRSRMR